jgi:hypothetical protein
MTKRKTAPVGPGKGPRIDDGTAPDTSAGRRDGTRPADKRGTQALQKLFDYFSQDTTRIVGRDEPMGHQGAVYTGARTY